MTNPTRERTDEEIEALSGDIADVVRRADPTQREELRRYAAELVRGATEADELPRTESRGKRRRARRGSLIGVALLLLVVGLGLVVLVPPVGATIAALSMVLLVAAVAATLAATVPRSIARMRRHGSGDGGTPTAGTGTH